MKKNTVRKEVMKLKLKKLCLATGEIFENVDIIDRYEFPHLGEMLRIKEEGKIILINTDFVLTAEPLYLE